MQHPAVTASGKGVSRCIHQASTSAAAHPPIHASRRSGVSSALSPDCHFPADLSACSAEPMPDSSRSLCLTSLTWVEVSAHLAHDRRLIVPVGTCDQHGPHLPIGTSTLIADALCAELSSDFGVLRAPALEYGVNLPTERSYAGTATLREKTLHRMLNDLLSSWEDHGFEEFILITAYNYDPHVEALATVIGTQARVRVIEALGIDLSAFTEGPDGAGHGGEIETSLMLHLYPKRVQMADAEDFQVHSDASVMSHTGSLTRIPATSPGTVGLPTLATAEKGRLIYEYIVQKIRAKVFLAAEAQDA